MYWVGGKDSGSGICKEKGRNPKASKNATHLSEESGTEAPVDAAESLMMDNSPERVYSAPVTLLHPRSALLQLCLELVSKNICF
jgi:hypothetical protein